MSRRGERVPPPESPARADLESARTRPGYRARRGRLFTDLEQAGELLVAFSGGVDSSTLLHAAHSVLGERAVGVIADSPSLPRRELRQALALAEQMGARLEVVATREGDDERYRTNSGDRCYWCKAALFTAMEEVSARVGLRNMAFGEIVDDALDDRPGARAALERGVRSPLSAAGFDKRDVRRYAREAGLGVSEKPSSACLASRIPVGTRVTTEALARVEAAEEALRDFKFAQLRVRAHGVSALVEVEKIDLLRAQSHSERISERLACLGFERVEMALYRSPGKDLRSN